MSSILRRRSRVLIAILAVAIGATTLSGLATIAIDVPAQMAREVRSYGANLVVSPASSEESLDDATLAAVDRAVPKDTLVGSAAFEYVTVLVNDQPFLAAGSDLESVRAMNPYWFVEGEWPQAEGEILIGEEIAQTIGAQPGDQILVAALADPSREAKTQDETAGQAASDGPDERDQHDDATEQTPLQGQSVYAQKSEPLPFLVSGILKTGGNEDAYMYTGSSDIQRMTGNKAAVSIVEYSIATEAEQLSQIAQSIENEASNVSARVVKRLASSDSGVLDMLRSLLAIITGIVLALTMIGVSTTMVAVVAERRTEIGLRKALGASSRSVVIEFVGESALLGLVGGGLGALFGYALAYGVTLNVFHRSLDVPVLILMMTVLASVGVSVLACLPPVRRAAAIDPALVLRGE